MIQDKAAASLAAGSSTGALIPLRRTGFGRRRERADGICTTARDPGAPAHREDVYFRAADFFGGEVFFRGDAFAVGGLRASLTALPAWNRTALLAAISMVSPVCGFRP
jgi:hypothetical protein